MRCAGFNLRDIDVFRPYSDEIPEQLLWWEGLSEKGVEPWVCAEMVRIAKYRDKVLGMYAVDRGDGCVYRLHGVVVVPAGRRQGLGRWLVGHAIGVAESKGGRHLLFGGEAAREFFGTIGFVDDPGGQRFDMIQE